MLTRAFEIEEKLNISFKSLKVGDEERLTFHFI